MDRKDTLEGANIWRQSGDVGREEDAVCDAWTAKTWSAHRTSPV